MSAHRRLALLAIVSAATLGACSILIPIGDLSAEGAPVAPDARGDDPSIEPAPIDAGDERLSRPCGEYAPPPIFCDDIDALQDFSARWSSEYSPSGSLEKHADAAVTPPSALRAAVRVPPNGESAHATLSTPLSGLPSRVRYDYDLRVAAGTKGSVPLNRFRIGDVELNLRVAADGQTSLHTKVNDAFQAFELPELGRDRWRHLTITVDVSSTTARVWVAFDGIPVLEDQPLRAAVAPGKEGGLLTAGVFFITSDDGPWTVLVDNVVLRPAPLP